MPVSPLMQQGRVRRAISEILMCFTSALLPPVLETQALVVAETISIFKRSLRIRDVDYPSMYVGWLVYAYLTAAPVCVLGSITLILIFRWIHLLFTMTLIFVYVSVMIMIAMIMAMYHTETWIACLWTTLFTLLQTFLAELIVHHKIDLKHEVFTFILHLFIPPLGLMHGLNEFALLQTGQRWESIAVTYTITSWLFIIALYFGLLMILQRTVKQNAIGGQVSWKSIIFKKAVDVNKLHHIETPSGKEREKLQEVDELVAKAISLRNVTKSIMGGPVLSNVTLDIYRGEFTMLYSEPIQQNTILAIEDLLTGLTYPDKGTVTVLGEELKPGLSPMSMTTMMGYCHRNGCLVDDLTVQEHLTLFCRICLWNESTETIAEYVEIRSKRLLSECDLEGHRHEYVRNLGAYYRAQLSWALALLLEPRVVIIPSFTSDAIYTAVIRDKIMQYKRYITIVNLCFTSISLEYADRVFIFDHEVLVFGGTPAYMFFNYGREYRVRVTFRSGGRETEENVSSLLSRTSEAGATVRAHLGSLLILRLPASPTANVASLVKDLTDNAGKYGIISMNISVPDSEEVCNRAIYESRASIHGSVEEREITKNALNNIAEPVPWQRRKDHFGNMDDLVYMGWKFIAFYYNYRFYFIITVLSALVSGVFIGISLSSVLAEMESHKVTKTSIHGEILTVEALEQKTNLILKCDNTSDALSIANAYVMSETAATKKEVKHMYYTALLDPESLTEYLVTRAIYSPQDYVYMFAYGLDVALVNNSLCVKVLYSPLHHDQGAAARSLARTYMALIRHYTSILDATIQVTDYPMAFDLTTWLKTASAPPILIQFLLILTISHITLIPSKESGFVRHMQSHALNFSPARYWFTLFVCDFILYFFLVILMTAAMVAIMVLVAPRTFYYTDLVVVPLMLLVYGLGCIPQAYLFSMGPRTSLNTMAYVILNVVFGETTVLAKLLYGNALNYVVNFMTLSPQFNMAYAFIKIRKIFLYNSECIVFERKSLCSLKMFHKCCSKCGVLQECFSRRFYLAKSEGVLMDMIAILTAAVVFMVLLLLWEYKYIQRLWSLLLYKLVYPSKPQHDTGTQEAKREKCDVLMKQDELLQKRRDRVDTFGEYLLACNVSLRKFGKSVIRNVYLGLGKGEALAISGLSVHGRLRLCEILSGYEMSTEGNLWCLSKWRSNRDPHQYAQNVTLSCDLCPLPHWMTVYNGLEMLAILRGVPKAHARQEVMNYVDALGFHQQADTVIQYLSPGDLCRLHFAAATVGAPTIIVLDEYTAYQKYSVQRAMYYILYHLRKRGHGIIISSTSVESHLPVTNRLAILVKGHIHDIDQVDNLVTRYSDKGFTVVLHLKNDVNVEQMFAKHFKIFVINDMTEVQVNIQVLDATLTWGTVFERMEELQAENRDVYSYIITATPIDYVYNSIVSYEIGRRSVIDDEKSCCCKYLYPQKPKAVPKKETLDGLIPFEQRFHITKLTELPWSVIFNR
ncbi:uncharacterized protein LOC120630088 [Pararge aegeria]|uniref:uncharacterized protein LOC120630088 n=1 Tax=Pararge aegeria TaxID=116150 RepID=UPI0019D1FB2E|nr:uncharacterized protein LOC120630088 [Pararge aegeria]